MRRRLDLAAALVARPPVLFLAEPTQGELVAAVAERHVDDYLRWQLQALDRLESRDDLEAT